MNARQASLVLVALLSLAFLANAETSLYVPAVDANGQGILTTITCRAMPGKGDVYISVEPLISVETQQSERTAVKIAAEKAGVDRAKWDVFFKIVAPAESVDGPSGGAAMALLAYAELSGKTPRRDLVVTGSIERDGRIGKIGGVLAKAEAVHNQGLSVFLVPLGQGVQEGVDLTQVAWEKWKMTVVEIKDIDEALKIAFAPEGTKIEVPQRITQPLILASISAPSSTLPMKTVAEQELSELQNLFEQQRDKLSELNRNATEESLSTARKLLQSNYYYSAANEAFLTHMGLEAFTNLNVTASEFSELLGNLEEQLNQTTFPNVTTENFEWIAGAQMRYYWAKARLAELKERLPMVKDPSFLLRDLASVKGWLTAAKRLTQAAPTGGEVIDESKLKEYADAMFQQVSAVVDGDPTLDSEAVFHLDAAELAYNDSRFLTATYDLQYSIAFYNSTDETSDLTSQEIRELLAGKEQLTNENFTSSVWGSLFFAHSLYNLAEADRSGDLEFVSNAHRLQQLARSLSANRQGLLRALGGEFVPPVRASTTPAPEQTGATPTPTPRPTLQTIEITTASQVPQTDGLEKGIVLAVLVATGAGVLILSAFILMRMLERKPPARVGPEQALERLDELLLQGKVSEDTYERLRLKYQRQLGNGGANGRSKPAKRSRRRG